MSTIKDYLNLVKFAHTIFALPFALIGFTMGVLYLIENGLFDYAELAGIFVAILVCMVSARNAAMGYNRYADRDIDAKNPRTLEREIPAGRISPKKALIFILVNSLIFIIASGIISTACLILTPFVLLILLGYSKVKRVSALCHFVLGLALGMAPAGAFIAVTGSHFSLSDNANLMMPWGWAVLILSFIVILWVSGFDILYSLADEDFDKKLNLHSIPALIGRRKAMCLSLILHLIIIPLLFVLFYLIFKVRTLNLGAYICIIGGIIFSFLLIWQHCIISPNNLKRLNAAFFTTNGIASALFAIFTIAGLILAIN